MYYFGMPEYSRTFYEVYFKDENGTKHYDVYHVQTAEDAIELFKSNYPSYANNIIEVKESRDLSFF